MRRATRFRLLPLVEWSAWGGDMDDGNSAVSGRSVSFAWLGLYLEMIVAREHA